MNFLFFISFDDASTLSLHDIWRRILISLSVYFIAAGLVYFIFYVWQRRNLLHLRIQKKFPAAERIWFEIKWSIVSRIIFVGIGVVMFSLIRQGYTQIYYEISDYGWFYLFFSILVSILLHDTYFYWIHRFMHWKPMMKHVHYVHHRSTNPTPWAAFSFHPVEALLEAAIMPLLIFFLPLHPIALITIGLYQVVMNVFGHSGYEIMPQGFVHHPIFKWYNAPTHHNLHHAKFNCNYSLYFTFWDRIMGTLHQDYEKTFDQVKAQQPLNEFSAKNSRVGISEA